MSVDALIKATQNATDTAAQAGFADTLAALHAAKFTGSIVLHFAQGRPRELQIPQAVRVKLT